MFEFTINQESDCKVLVLKGSLTIQHAVEIKEVFISSIDKYDTIKINHIEADEYDLTYLQLLLASERTALNLNKTIYLESPNSDIFNNLLKKVGLFANKWLGAETKSIILSEEVNG